MARHEEADRISSIYDVECRTENTCSAARAWGGPCLSSFQADRISSIHDVECRTENTP